MNHLTDYTNRDVYRDFTKISKDIGIVMDRGSFRRVIDASEDAQTIVRCIRKISHAIDIFVVCKPFQVGGIMSVMRYPLG